MFGFGPDCGYNDATALLALKNFYRTHFDVREVDVLEECPDLLRLPSIRCNDANFVLTQRRTRLVDEQIDVVGDFLGFFGVEPRRTPAFSLIVSVNSMEDKRKTLCWKMLPAGQIMG